MRRLSTVLSLGALLGTILGACGGDDFDDCHDTSTCPPGDASSGKGGSAGTTGTGGAAGTSGSGGTGGGGTGATGATGGTNGTGPDTGCDLSKSLTEDNCAIDEAYGVFVSAQGADAGDGTRASPYRTIEEGMTAAKRAGKRVYVCADGGSYPEPLNIGAAMDGLEVYGGFRCDNWQYSGALKAEIATTTPIAVRVTGLQMGLTLEDFSVTAADATVDGGSSFGMIVANSRNVVLRRVRVTAGAGKAGANGSYGVRGEEGTMVGAAQSGKPVDCSGDAGALQNGGAWSDPSACGSIGGLGGAGYKLENGDSGRAGTPNTNVNPPINNNGGIGATVVGANGGAGQTGSNGNPGPNGTVASPAGTFTATGFTPANGNDGTNGFPGQGGGGGGASKGNGANCIGASGGAGGMGGCGGTKGLGGGGGGASIALLSWMSDVTLDGATLVAKSGGAGGKGGNAGPGGSGGGGAAGGGNGGTALGSAGRGGDGGQGGPGGSGSGGTGGPSHALVFHGTAPTKTTAPTLMAAAGGAKGVGGMVLGGEKAPDGSEGASTPEHQQP